MAKWLFDPIATQATGSNQFRRPYPKDDWIDDMKWNQWPTLAMEHVAEADRVFCTPGEKWGKKENKFFKDMMKGLADANL